MLLRLRVELPDRPGSLGQVARTLGVVGADIVSVIVLERAQGRAVDDFTVVWPASAWSGGSWSASARCPVCAWWGCGGAPSCPRRSAGRGSPGSGGGRPGPGLATLVDGVPGLVAADWAAVDSRRSGLGGCPGEARRLTVRYASWGAPLAPEIPDVATAAATGR
jgi:hypothetical protein